AAPRAWSLSIAALVFNRQAVAALQHRNFRLIWIGLLFSFTGSLMQNTALLWHVSLLVAPERKGLALGFVGLARVVPVVVFSMVSGVVADALDRRRVLIATQAIAMGVALTLGVLTFQGLTVAWPVYLLAAAGAGVGAFDLPARQALIPTLVPRDVLPNAISLNTIMFQTASVTTVARAVLHVGANGYGWLFPAPAVGAFVTSVALVPLMPTLDRRGATLLWSVVVYGLATVVFGASRSFWLTFACLAVTGA